MCTARAPLYALRAPPCARALSLCPSLPLSHTIICIDTCLAVYVCMHTCTYTLYVYVCMYIYIIYIYIYKHTQRGREHSDTRLRLAVRRRGDADPHVCIVGYWSSCSIRWKYNKIEVDKKMMTSSNKACNKACNRACNNAVRCRSSAASFCMQECSSNRKQTVATRHGAPRSGPAKASSLPKLRTLNLNPRLQTLNPKL